MDAQSYWELFMDTGAPEMYLMYQQARKMEVSNACNGQGLGTAGHSL